MYYVKRLVPSIGLVLLGLAVLPAAPAGATAFPSAPTGVHVTAVTHSSFTVGLNRSTNARSYRLYVSRTKSDVYVNNIKTGHTTSGLRVFSSTTPSLKAGGLTYTTAPYYYRITAVNGSNRAFSSDFWSIGLRPTTPTSFHVVDRHLLWAAGPATGFTIQRATNSAMTTGVVNESIRGQAHEYTPFGMSSGTIYWFRVRAVNQRTAGSWTSPAVSMAVRTHEQSARVMTYNILINTSDGTTESGNTIANWVPGRRDAAAALIEGVDPSVIAIQEGNNWVGDPQQHVRQVDSLNNAINGGRTYRVAHTEPLFGESGFVRTGDYILYKPSVYDAYAAGGHWDIDTAAVTNTRWAAYQPLRNIATGAKFLFVCTHPIAGSGSAYDQRREDETSTLVQLATAKAAALGIPVVYAGDFNSNPTQHPLDGPGVVMRNAHIADARDVSPTHTNEKYDSENEYSRIPLAYSIFIDYIYAGPDVSVTSWGQALHLSSGKFVGVIPSDHNPIYAGIRYPY
jgi:endonuclease/exonuclease/phosphatase family metal-dependent hydrolase